MSTSNFKPSQECPAGVSKNMRDELGLITSSALIRIYSRVLTGPHAALFRACAMIERQAN
jgi:hypothetical protein